MIIEGTNYAGKDTIFTFLSPLCKNAVIIQIRGYWRRVLQDPLGLALSCEELLSYFKERTHSFLSLIRSVSYEELLLMRLHLTDRVYSRLYMQREQDYNELEQQLNELNVGLILLDVDDRSLEARRNKDPRGTSGHADRSLLTLITKRDLYREEFKKSQVICKLLVNNFDDGPTPAEQAQSIIDWWNKRT